MWSMIFPTIRFVRKWLPFLRSMAEGSATISPYSKCFGRRWRLQVAGCFRFLPDGRGDGSPILQWRLPSGQGSAFWAYGQRYDDPSSLWTKGAGSGDQNFSHSALWFSIMKSEGPTVFYHSVNYFCQLSPRSPERYFLFLICIDNLREAILEKTYGTNHISNIISSWKLH